MVTWGKIGAGILILLLFILFLPGCSCSEKNNLLSLDKDSPSLVNPTGSLGGTIHIKPLSSPTSPAVPAQEQMDISVYSQAPSDNIIPLPGAIIKVGSKSTVTDESGRFFISGLKTGRNRIRISKKGFITLNGTVTIPTNKIHHIEPLMEPHYYGWMNQNPDPFEGTLTDICFINRKTGWAVGERGTILFTEIVNIGILRNQIPVIGCML